MTKKHNTQLGFKVPEGYFETSAREHLAFLDNQRTEKSSGFFKRNTLVFIGCLSGLLVFVWFYNQYNTSVDAQSFENLTIESLDINEGEFDEWFDENFVLSEV